MKNKRKLKEAIFIACEGKHTERIYFEAIGEETDVAERFSVTIYPSEDMEKPTTHALGLVQLAQSMLDDFDEVWAVFDKDGYTRHPQTFAAANVTSNEKKVNIAFSSIAFEQWILNHFCRSETAYKKSSDIVNELRVKNFFPGYEKTSYQQTYAIIKDKTLIALENTAWQKFQLEVQGVLPNTPIYEINPYTDVDHLVKRLLSINEEISWSAIGREFVRPTFSVTAIITPGNVISINFTNNLQQAIVFNTQNLNSHFYLADPERQTSYLNVTEAVQINPGGSQTFSLTSDVSINGRYLNFIFNNHRVLMEI